MTEVYGYFDANGIAREPPDLRGNYAYDEDFFFPLYYLNEALYIVHIQAEQFDALVAALPLSEGGEEAQLKRIAKLQLLAENDAVGQELQRQLEVAGIRCRLCLLGRYQVWRFGMCSDFAVIGGDWIDTLQFGCGWFALPNVFDALVAALPLSEGGEEAQLKRIAKLQLLENWSIVRRPILPEFSSVCELIVQVENDAVGQELQRQLEVAGKLSDLSAFWKSQASCLCFECLHCVLHSI